MGLFGTGGAGGIGGGGGGIPPHDLTTFTSQSTEDGILLSFSGPEPTYLQDGDGQPVFAAAPRGIMIRYSTEGYPLKETDGVFGYNYYPEGEDWDGTGTHTCTIVGLTKDTKYYFTAFPYSDYGVYNRSESTKNRTEMTWVGNKGTISVNVQPPSGYLGTIGQYTITLVDQDASSPQNIEKTVTGAGVTQFGGLVGGKSYKVRLSSPNDDLKAPPDSEVITVLGGVNHNVTMTYITKYGNVVVKVSVSPSNLKIGSYTVTLTSQDGGQNETKTKSGAGSVTFNNLEDGKTYIATLSSKSLCTGTQSSVLTVKGGDTVTANLSYTFNFNKTLGESTWTEIDAIGDYGVTSSVFAIGESKNITANYYDGGTDPAGQISTQAILIEVLSNGHGLFFIPNVLYASWVPNQWVGSYSDHELADELSGLDFVADSDFGSPVYTYVSACGQKTGTTTNQPQGRSVQWFPPNATMLGFASSVNGTETPGQCSYFTSNASRKIKDGMYATASQDGISVTASTHEWVGVSSYGSKIIIGYAETDTYGWPICFVY